MAALPVDPHLYAAFLGVMAVMAITPGPANLFAVATGMEKGRASALIGVVGMNAARMAAGLGAEVVVVERSIPRMRQLDDMFLGRILTRYSTLDAVEEEVRRPTW